MKDHAEIYVGVNGGLLKRLRVTGQRLALELSVPVPATVGLGGDVVHQSGNYNETKKTSPSS